MSKLPLLVVGQKFHYQSKTFLFKETSKVIAEAKAELWYIENTAHRVEVIEFNEFGHTPEEKLNAIFSISRHCNCQDLQRNFNFKKMTTYLECPYCKIVFGQEVSINEHQDIQQQGENIVSSEDNKGVQNVRTQETTVC